MRSVECLQPQPGPEIRMRTLWPGSNVTIATVVHNPYAKNSCGLELQQQQQGTIIMQTGLQTEQKHFLVWKHLLL